jgi:predicted permease
MNSILYDLRYALRQLRRAPGFAIIAIATLALSIGTATAVFSVIDATIIRPLPFNDPDLIVRVQTYSPQGYGQPASWPEYLDWRHGNQSLSALAGYQAGSGNLESASGASAVRVVSGTDNFFDVFAVNPLLGRTFAPGEDAAGKNDVVVLSYELWQQSFGGSKNVLGTTLKIDGSLNTVIGVMPAGFRYPLSMRNAVYRPFHLSSQQLQSRGMHFLPVIARLKPGITPTQAQQDMTRVFSDLARTYPDSAGRRAKVMTLAEATLGKTAAPLRVLCMAVGGVLLIGCINVAALLLARGVRRQRELSLRSAIGATRSRIVRQLLTESAVLALAGGIAGIALSAALLQTIRQLLIHSLARGADVHLNLAVLAATFTIAVLSGLVAGALPALQSSRLAPSQALRAGGSAGTSRAQNRLRSCFIAVQVAVALGLLVCSGLLLRNLHTLKSTGLGFSTDHLMTFDVALTAANYRGRDVLTSYYQPLAERMSHIPGVTHVGFISLFPIESWGSNGDVNIVGHPPAPPNQERLAEIRVITPGTVEAIGGHLVRGRMLDASIDHAGSQFAVTVNEAFVRKFFAPGEDPLGRQLDWGDPKPVIVGVTSDIRQDLNQPALAEFDFSAAQLPAAQALDNLAELTMVVRTNGSTADLIAPTRAAMHEVDPTVPFREPQTVEQIIAETLTFERLEGWLFGVFAALALTLSLVGIYGMVQHEVELRTRDIGIRMALGSTRGAVVRKILGRVALLMLCGIALGWSLTLALQKVMASVVELKITHDVALLTTLTLTLGLIGIAASLLPARRAASIDPMQALRTE